MYRTSVYRRQARAKAIRRKKFYAHATGWIYTQTGIIKGQDTLFLPYVCS